MLRTSFGKLAIAVLAVSGVAAHADSDGFLNKLRGSTVGGEAGIAPFVSEAKGFPMNFTTPGKDTNLHGVFFRSPVLTQLGPVQMMYSAGFDGIYASDLYNDSKATEAQAEKIKLETDGKKDEAAEITIRAKGNEKGVFAQLLGVTAAYNAFESLSLSLGAGVGPVVTAWHPSTAWDQMYFAGSARVAGSYKITPNWAFEGSLKGVMPFTDYVKNVGALRVGLSFTY